MGRFATGVTVVTTFHDHRNYGLTVNAFCSVSLDPLLVMISLDQTSQTFGVIQKSQIFAINILTANQQELAERFARKDIGGNKTFAGIPLHIGENGAPLFQAALAHIECSVAALYPAGDHTLVLGEVTALDYDPGTTITPLLYFRSTYGTMAPETTVTDVIG